MKKNKSLLLLMLLMFALTIVQAQDAPPKHRGMHPVLKADGTVVDEAGKPLGSIKRNGKVCDATGKVIGIITKSGEVKSVSGKAVAAVMGKDGSSKTKMGQIVTTDPDGVVQVAGKKVGQIEKGYKNKSHGCALHCFFNSENDEAKEVDAEITQ
jgi:hypothetical protein